MLPTVVTVGAILDGVKLATADEMELLIAPDESNSLSATEAPTDATLPPTFAKVFNIAFPEEELNGIFRKQFPVKVMAGVRPQSESRTYKLFS